MKDANRVIILHRSGHAMRQGLVGFRHLEFAFHLQPGETVIPIKPYKNGFNWWCLSSHGLIIVNRMMLTCEA